MTRLTRFHSSNHWNCSGGAAGYIDRMVFGLNHIKVVLSFRSVLRTWDLVIVRQGFENIPFQPTTGDEMIYKPDQYYFSPDEMTPSYDPVGLLGSINSIVVVFLGLQAGKILLHYSEMKSRIIRFFIWGCEYGPEMDRKRSSVSDFNFKI